VRARSVWLTLGSFSLAVILIVALLRISKIDLGEVIHTLRNINHWAFAWFTILMGVHVLLASQKWQAIDSVIRGPDDAALPRSTSFALTSVGIALGQILPPSLAMVVARTLGTYDYGRPITRGTVGTLFEQGFDFLVICLLMPATVAVRVFHGSQGMWIATATATALLGFLALQPFIQGLQRVASFFSSKRAETPGRLQRRLIELRGSGLLKSTLARKLMLLSMFRFVILVFMAGQAAKAIGVNVPLWHLGAAMSFVVFSGVVGLTPGGIGVSELAYAAVLNVFGTPLAVAAQFSIANRFLVVIASFIVAICGVGIVFVMKIHERSRRKAASGVAIGR